MEGRNLARLLVFIIIIAFVSIVGAIAIALIVEDNDLKDQTSVSALVETPADPNIDDDTWIDVRDNCPFVFNPTQEDTDEDGIGDACDDTSGPSSFDLLGPFISNYERGLAWLVYNDYNKSKSLERGSFFEDAFSREPLITRFARLEPLEGT